MNSNGFDDFVAGLQHRYIGVAMLDHEIFLPVQIVGQQVSIRIPKMDWSIVPVIKKNGGHIEVIPAYEQRSDSDVHLALNFFANDAIELEYSVKYETGSDGIDHYVSIYRYGDGSQIAFTVTGFQSTIYCPYGSHEFTILDFVILSMIEIHRECVERLEL